MSMNDEQFEATMECLRDELADNLRARDTAQREALARVEAERDALKAENAELAGSIELEDASSHYREQQLKAQLAEAVGLLNTVVVYSEWLTRPELVGEIEAFLSRPAQAEQQEAQGAQAGDECVAKAIYDADRSLFMTKREYSELHETTKARLRKMARAALATQPAAGEPVAPKPIGYISEAVLQELLHGKHVPANICTATPSRRNPHPGPDANWSVPIYTAPPAAAPVAAGEPAAWECVHKGYLSLSYEKEGDPERAVPLFRAAPPAAANGDCPDRALKKALFACVKAGGEPRTYGGVLTESGYAWVRFTVEEAAMRAQAGEGEDHA